MAYYHIEFVTAASGRSQRFGAFDSFEPYIIYIFLTWNMDPKRSTGLAWRQYFPWQIAHSLQVLVEVTVCSPGIYCLCYYSNFQCTVTTATAASMADKRTGFKIRFCACLCYNLEFLSGECPSLFLYYHLFWAFCDSTVKIKTSGLYVAYVPVFPDVCWYSVKKSNVALCER